MFALISFEIIRVEHFKDRIEMFLGDLAALRWIKAHAFGYITAGAPTGAKFHSTIAEHVERGDAFRDANWIVDRHEHDAERQPQGRRALAERRQVHIGRG